MEAFEEQALTLSWFMGLFCGSLQRSGGQDYKRFPLSKLVVSNLHYEVTEAELQVCRLLAGVIVEMDG